MNCENTLCHLGLIRAKNGQVIEICHECQGGISYCCDEAGANYKHEKNPNTMAEPTDSKSWQLLPKNSAIVYTWPLAA